MRIGKKGKKKKNMNKRFQSRDYQAGMGLSHVEVPYGTFSLATMHFIFKRSSG